MRRIAGVGLLALLVAGGAGADAGRSTMVAGAWSLDPSLDGTLRATAGEAPAFHPLPGSLARAAVLRGWVSLGFGTAGAGVRLPDGTGAGIGTREEGAGFRVLGSDGMTAWSDPGCPIAPYQGYPLEIVLEGRRYRAQLLASDGRAVLSQSPWLPREGAARGAPALYCQGGIARFGNWTGAAAPLSELLDFPPNEARLGGAGWTILGGGAWRWADSRKASVSQDRPVERSFALRRERSSAMGTTRARIRIHPGAGGAGIVTQASEDLARGFSCWLGGTFGAGSLMLYTHTPTGPRQLWMGKPDQWHYDEDRVVETTTRPGEARVRLFAADGRTLLDESPWIAVDGAASEAEGYLALQTWLGTAEFSGFPGAGEAGTTVDAGGDAGLGAGWRRVGGGAARWVAAAGGVVELRAGEAGPSALLPPGIEGTMGHWSCTVSLSAGSIAGLAIQTSAQVDRGLALLLGDDGRVTLRETGAGGPPIWEAKAELAVGIPYMIRLERLTDVVSIRLTGPDGKVLAERERCYIPARYNTLQGRLALVVERAAAVFGAWRLEGAERP